MEPANLGHPKFSQNNTNSYLQLMEYGSLFIDFYRMPCNKYIKL